MSNNLVEDSIIHSNSMVNLNMRDEKFFCCDTEIGGQD
jgi:hypothetical protein